MFRALNKNQILILSEIENNSCETISRLLKRISKFSEISLSTLKLNAKILKKLDLIDFGNSSVCHLTEPGKYVTKLLCFNQAKSIKRVRSLTCCRISALGADDRSSNLLGPTIRKVNKLSNQMLNNKKVLNL